MDPNNPVIKLCIEGMKAESERKFDEASNLFKQAWEIRKDDYDACIAAHYVARHQESPEDTLKWNQISLDNADRVDDERVQGFYPSLYLNIGKSFEDLGDKDGARRYYELAAGKIDALPDDRYGHILRNAVIAGMNRIGDK